MLVERDHRADRKSKQTPRSDTHGTRASRPRTIMPADRRPLGIMVTFPAA